MTTTEKYFRALGFEWGLCPKLLHGTQKDEWCWMSKKEGYKTKFEELPNITQHYPDFKRWVLLEMGRRNVKLHVTMKRVGWHYFGDNIPLMEKMRGFSSEIKDNEILEAACEAATHYLEGKNE